MSVSKIVQQWLFPLMVLGFVCTEIQNISAQTAPTFAGNGGNAVLNATNGHLFTIREFHHTLLDRMQPNFALQTVPQGDLIYRTQSCDTTCGKALLWGEFSQSWTSQADVGPRSSYEYRPTAFAFGQERRNGHWMSGLAGEYSHGRVKGGDFLRSDTQLDTLALGLYAGYFGTQDYLKGTMQFGVGWNKEVTYDRISVTRAYGSFHSATLGTGLEMGRTYRMMCKVNPLTVTPHIGTDYWFLNREAFTETGTVTRRSFGSVNYNVVEIPVGLRIARTIPMTGGKTNTITPSVDVIYARSVADGNPGCRGGLIGVPATWYESGTEPGRDIFRMNTAVTGRFCRCINVGLGFDFEVRNHYTSEQLHFTVGVTR